MFQLFELPEDYVRGVFDDIAAKYDDTIVPAIRYRGSELLVHAVARAIGIEIEVGTVSCRVLEYNPTHEL